MNLNNNIYNFLRQAPQVSGQFGWKSDEQTAYHWGNHWGKSDAQTAYMEKAHPAIWDPFCNVHRRPKKWVSIVDCYYVFPCIKNSSMYDKQSITYITEKSIRYYKYISNLRKSKCGKKIKTIHYSHSEKSNNSQSH